MNIGFPTAPRRERENLFLFASQFTIFFKKKMSQTLQKMLPMKKYSKQQNK